MGQADLPALGSGLAVTEANAQVSRTWMSWTDAKEPLGLRPGHGPAAYSAPRPAQAEGKEAPKEGDI